MMIPNIDARPDEAAMAAARAKWDAVAKPLHSLGRLEDMIVRIAGIQGTPEVALSPRSVPVFCADHGVVEEGVCQSDHSVTSAVAASIAAGESNVDLMAQVAGAKVFAVDVGMKQAPVCAGLIDRSVAKGTRNMTKGPAMTREEAIRAVEVGIDMVRLRKSAGDKLICIGEMGIGNTTASTAMACVLLGRSPMEMTGRGAGLSDAGLLRKRSAIARAIEVNRPDPEDALDVLEKLGGFEIAAMAGACLGGAIYRVPIVLDGVISLVAALTAVRLRPACRDFLLPSHMSREAAAAPILSELGLHPVIDADMALGEGTGAVAVLPLLDMAHRVYAGAHTFDRLGMDAYVPQEDKA